MAARKSAGDDRQSSTIGPSTATRPAVSTRGPRQRAGAAGVGEHRDVRPDAGAVGWPGPATVWSIAFDRRHLDQSSLLVERAAERADRRRSGAHRDDRHRQRHPPGDAGELARVAERLGVHRDDLRVRVLLPELQQVVGGDVGLVAERHEPRQPEVEVSRLAEHRAAERARLHRDRHVAGGQRDVDERGLEQRFRARRGDAHARRPDQPQPVAAGPGDHGVDVDVGPVDGGDHDRTRACACGCRRRWWRRVDRRARR